MPMILVQRLNRSAHKYTQLYYSNYLQVPENVSI